MIASDIRKALIHKWPLRVLNGQGSVLSPFEIVRVTATSIVDGEVVYTVARPNTTFLSEYLVLGPLALGSASTDESVASTLSSGGLVQYDTGSTPSVGQEWGPQNAAGTIKRYRYGFRIIGSPTTVGSYSVVPARQYCVTGFIGKANADIGNSGGTAAASVYDLNQADTSLDISGCINRTGIDIASGDWLKGNVWGDVVYVEPWECP